MNFEDVCWLDSLFEKMMEDAKQVSRKNQVIAIIRERHELIKKEKEAMANGLTC